MLLFLESKGEGETTFEDEVWVFTMSQEFYVCPSFPEKTKSETIEEPESTFLYSILEVFKTAVITDTEKKQISTLIKFILAHSSNSDPRVAFASIEKPNIGSSVDRNRVLRRFCASESASWRVIPFSLRLRALHFRYDSLPVGPCRSPCLRIYEKGTVLASYG